MTKYLAVMASPELDVLVANTFDREEAISKAREYSLFEGCPIMIGKFGIDFNPDDDVIVWDDVDCIVFGKLTFVLADAVSEVTSESKETNVLKQILNNMPKEDISKSEDVGLLQIIAYKAYYAGILANKALENKEPEAPRTPERWLKKYESVIGGVYWLIFNTEDDGVFLTIARAKSRGDVFEVEDHPFEFLKRNRTSPQYIVCQYTETALKELGLTKP